MRPLADATLALAMYFPDTIVAPATAPGSSAIAIIRLSGPDAITIARQLWHPLKPTATLTPRRLYLGMIRDPATGACLDQAMLTIMPAPHSFTAEDIAELQCHGGPYLVRRILALAAAAGARIAAPGEFSRRAFLNGRFDLTAAEAIADLINANSEVRARQGPRAAFRCARRTPARSPSPDHRYPSTSRSCDRFCRRRRRPRFHYRFDRR